MIVNGAVGAQKILEQHVAQLQAEKERQITEIESRFQDSMRYLKMGQK